MQVAEQQVWTRRERRGNRGQMRKTPDRVIQDRQITSGFGQAARFRLRELLVPDDLPPRHGFHLAGRLERAGKARLIGLVDGQKILVDVLPPVGERQNTDPSTYACRGPGDTCAASVWRP